MLLYVVFVASFAGNKHHIKDKYRSTEGYKTFFA